MPALTASRVVTWRRLKRRSAPGVRLASTAWQPARIVRAYALTARSAPILQLRQPRVERKARAPPASLRTLLEERRSASAVTPVATVQADLSRACAQEIATRESTLRLPRQLDHWAVIVLIVLRASTLTCLAATICPTASAVTPAATVLVDP